MIDFVGFQREMLVFCHIRAGKTRMRDPDGSPREKREKRPLEEDPLFFLNVVVTPC